MASVLPDDVRLFLERHEDDPCVEISELAVHGGELNHKGIEENFICVKGNP